MTSPVGCAGDGWAVPGVTGLRAAVPVGLPPVSAPVEALQAAVAAQAAVDAMSVPGPQALADLAGLLQARDLLERVLLARVGDVQARQLAVLDGAGSTSSWLRQQAVDLPVGTVATARRLLRHPLLGEAVADGRLRPRDAELIGRALAQAGLALDRRDGLIDGQDAQPVLAAVVIDGVLSCLGTAFGGLSEDSPKAVLLNELADDLSEIAWQVQCSQLDRLERAWVLMAQHLPAGWLGSSLALLLGALVPSRLEDGARRAERDRRLTLTPDPDGGGHVRGRLSAQAFELLHAVLAAAAETDPDNPADTDAWKRARDAGWLPGDPLPDDLLSGDLPTGGDGGAPSGPGQLVRSRPVRLHDALLIALRAVLDSAGLGVRGKAAPHIAVTVPLSALNGGPGALPAVGGSGQRLALTLVTGWMRDAYVTRYVLDLRHRVIETSHTERTLKAHERRIKTVETGGACQSRACPRGPDSPPGVRLVPHHPDAWARTGTTSVGDTVMLCEQGHTELHHGATLTLRDGRRLHADGWIQ